jgi:hypothetical protein
MASSIATPIYAWGSFMPTVITSLRDSTLWTWAQAFNKPGSLPIPAGGVDPWGISTRPVSKPVVIALKGTCFTLGVELALASDVVIAQRNTVCAQLEVARGILPFGGASTRMPAAAGWANAMRWLLSAESFSAEEAYRLNIVTEIVEEDPLERAREVANTIAQQAPLAVQETLASARAAQTDPARRAQTTPAPTRSSYGDPGCGSRHGSLHDQKARRLRGQLAPVE